MNYILKYLKPFSKIQLSPEQILLWFPAFIALGIYCTFSCTYKRLIFIAPILIFKNKTPFICALVLGVLAATIRLMTLSDVKMLNQNIEFSRISGTVLSSEYITNGLRFVVKTPDGSFRINWKGDYDANVTVPGNKIEFSAKIFPIKTKASPMSFNFRRHAYFQRISAGGVVLDSPELISESDGMAFEFKRIRDSVNTRLFDIFDDDIANVAAALLTGNKSGIDNNLRQSFIRSGTAHLLAISGLHVSLVGGFVFLLVRLLLCFLPFISLRKNPKKIAILFSFLSALLYFCIANGGIPATRAIIMHSIITISVLTNKNAFSMRNLALSGSVILLLSPEVIYSPGFYMSFFAVASLIHFYEKKTSTGNYFINIAKSSAIASFAVIPFSLYFFNNVTLNSIPANLIAIPLTGTIIMPSLLCFAAHMEWIGVPLIKFSISALIKTITFFGSWKYSYILLPTPPDISIQLLSLGLLLIFFSNLQHAGLSLVISGVILYWVTPLPEVFVNRNATVFGIYDKGNLYVSDLVHDRSTSNSWMTTLGLKHKLKLIKEDRCYKINDKSIQESDKEIMVNDEVRIKKSQIIKYHGCTVTGSRVSYSEPDLGMPWLRDRTKDAPLKQL